MTFVGMLFTGLLAFVVGELLSFAGIYYLARKNGQTVREFVYGRFGITYLSKKVDAANEYAGVMGLTTSSILKALPKRTRDKAFKNLIANFKTTATVKAGKGKAKVTKTKKALRLGRGA